MGREDSSSADSSACSSACSSADEIDTDVEDESLEEPMNPLGSLLSPTLTFEEMRNEAEKNSKMRKEEMGVKRMEHGGSWEERIGRNEEMRNVDLSVSMFANELNVRQNRVEDGNENNENVVPSNKVSLDVGKGYMAVSLEEKPAIPLGFQQFMGSSEMTEGVTSSLTVCSDTSNKVEAGNEQTSFLERGDFMRLDATDGKIRQDLTAVTTAASSGVSSPSTTGEECSERQEYSDADWYHETVSEELLLPQEDDRESKSQSIDARSTAKQDQSVGDKSAENFGVKGIQYKETVETPENSTLSVTMKVNQQPELGRKHFCKL